MLAEKKEREGRQNKKKDVNRYSASHCKCLNGEDATAMRE